MELLQRKVQSLEEENKSLKVEAQKIVEETDEVEEHERKLIADYAQHLSTVNTEFDGLSEYTQP
jgi:trafficking kinesin-binding protein 1